MQSGNASNKETNFIAIWSKCIDIQMHFNSLNLTIKSLAITGFTFFISGIGYLYKEKVYLEEVNVLMWFSLMGVLIIFLFYFIDRYWYHQYLKATSAHIEYIENQDILDNDLRSALNVSQKIAEESKKPINGILLNSRKRTNLFYIILIIPFIIISIYASLNHNNIDDAEKFKIIENKSIEVDKQLKELERQIYFLKKDSILNFNITRQNIKSNDKSK